MTIKEEFEKAALDVQSLPEKPNTDVLLSLYSLYKQSTEGDVKGNRPGMLDLVGRKKYDAWAARKGLAPERAMHDYVDLVKKLRGK